MRTALLLLSLQFSSLGLGADSLDAYLAACSKNGSTSAFEVKNFSALLDLMPPSEREHAFEVLEQRRKRIGELIQKHQGNADAIFQEIFGKASRGLKLVVRDYGIYFLGDEEPIRVGDRTGGFLGLMGLFGPVLPAHSESDI